MRADQRKLGKSSWAAAVERTERLQYAVSKETLQLMRAKEICLEQKKHALKEEVRRAGHSRTPVLTLYGRAGSETRNQTRGPGLSRPGSAACV